jgi:hypothetical protein
MPIWLRNFTFKKIDEFYRKQSESNKPKNKNDIDLANPNKSKLPNKKTITPPTYVTKASRK